MTFFTVTCNNSTHRTEAVREILEIIRTVSWHAHTHHYNRAILRVTTLIAHTLKLSYDTTDTSWKTVLLNSRAGLRPLRSPAQNASRRNHCRCPCSTEVVIYAIQKWNILWEEHVSCRPIMSHDLHSKCIRNCSRIYKLGTLPLLELAWVVVCVCNAQITKDNIFGSYITI